MAPKLLSMIVHLLPDESDNYQAMEKGLPPMLHGKNCYLGFILPGKTPVIYKCLKYMLEEVEGRGLLKQQLGVSNLSIFGS